MNQLIKMRRATGNEQGEKCKRQSEKCKVQSAKGKMLAILFFIFHFSLITFAQHTHADGSTHDDHVATEPAAEAVKMKKSEAISERYELVLKYEHLHADETNIMMLYVADPQTNKPIVDAKIILSATFDSKAKFDIKPKEAGIYEVKAFFSKERTFTLTVKIDGNNGADLMLLKGVLVGHGEEVHSHGHGNLQITVYSWQFWGILGGGLLMGILLTYFLMRVRHRKAFVVLIIVFSQLPTANWRTIQAQHVHADGSTHGGGEENNGQGAKKQRINEFEIPKETQFLFEILTQPLKEGMFDEKTQFYGTIIPSSTGQAVVQTPQTGRLISLNARVGQSVSKGQILATLEQTLDATAQVSLQTERNSMDAELTAARKEVERLKKIEDIAAKRDISEAEARLQKAEENLKVFNSITRGSKGNTRIMALTAPISGVIAPFSVAIGSTVGLGETIFTITNISKVYVEAQAFANDAKMLNKNAKLDVIGTAKSTQKQSDKIRLLSLAQVVNANQSQKLLFELNNANGAFKIGEFVSVRLKTAQSNSTLSLPNSSISQVNGKPAVFVKISPELFKVVFVATGNNNGEQTTILNGLTSGEKIVVNAAYQLKMMYLNQ